MKTLSGGHRVNAWPARHWTPGLWTPMILEHSNTPCHFPVWAREAPWTGHCFPQLDLRPRLYIASRPEECLFPELTGISDHYFNEKVFLALTLPGAFFQLISRAVRIKLRGENNLRYFFLIKKNSIQ